MMKANSSPEARRTLAASFATFEWDFSSGKVTATADLARLFGLRVGKSDINVDHLIAQVHARDLSQVKEALSNAKINGFPIDIEFRVVANARIRWLCIKAEVHRRGSLTPEWTSGGAFDISELKAAGEELNLYRSRVSVCHKLIKTEFWNSDRDRLRVESSFWRRLAGGLDILDFERVVHPADLRDLRQIWDEAANVRAPFTATFRALAIPGQYRWVRICGSPITANDGSVEEWVGAIEDVNEQFTHEEQLHACLEWLRLSNQTAGVHAWTDETEGLMSPLASLARSGAVTTLLKVDEGIHPEHRERVRQALDSVYQTGDPVELDYQTIPDGAWRRLKARGALSHRHLKRSVMGITVDITALKTAEAINAEMRESVRRAERVASAVFLATDGFVFSTNAQWEIQDSAGWASFTGQEQSEVSGFGWLNACHPTDRDAFRAAIRRCIFSGAASRFKALIRFQDGSYKPVAFGAEPITLLDAVAGWSIACVVLSAEEVREAASGSTQVISGDQVRAARAMLQWSVKDLAQRSGVSASTIRRFEDHESQISIRSSLLSALKEALQREGIRFFAGHGVGRAGPNIERAYSRLETKSSNEALRFVFR